MDEARSWFYTAQLRERFMKLLIVLFALAMTEGAVAGPTDSDDGRNIKSSPSIFKEYDSLEKRDKARQESELRDVAVSKQRADAADPRGKFPGQLNPIPSQPSTISVSPISKQIDTYCFGGSQGSTTCGSRYKW
jgi:hypothetical protein